MIKTDSETQTDTHFHESNIVASYEWNEWELRRKALKLVSSLCPVSFLFAFVVRQNVFAMTNIVSV